jgi:hypothetical protein
MQCWPQYLMPVYGNTISQLLGSWVKSLPSPSQPPSMLSHAAKLFERLLLRRPLPSMTLRAEQYGFRSGHSTTVQLARMLHQMARGTNEGLSTVVVFLDA